MKEQTNKEWRRARLVDVCDLNMGQSPSSKTYNSTGEGLPFFQGKADFGRRYPSIRMYCSDPKKTVNIGDILISVRAPVGPINVADTKSCIGRGLAGLRAKEKLLDQNFLYFELLLSEKRIASLGSGSIFHAINKSQLADFDFVLPPLPEQKTIAVTLTIVQNAITEQENLIAKLKELKQSMMQHLFTNGTSGEKTKMTEIGEMPESWSVVGLGEAAKFTRGPFGGSLKKEIFVKEGMAIYEQSHAIHGNLDTFRYFIDEKKFEEMKRFEVKGGDLIMSCSGTFGKIQIIPRDHRKGIINQALLRLEPLLVSPFYLKLILESSIFQYQLRSNILGVAIQNVASVSVLKQLKISLPSQEEQRRIEKSIETINDKTDCAEKKLLAYENLFKTLLHELMSGERRIKNI